MARPMHLAVEGHRADGLAARPDQRSHLPQPSALDRESKNAVTAEELHLVVAEAHIRACSRKASARSSPALSGWPFGPCAKS
jgi:hypothetical protein